MTKPKDFAAWFRDLTPKQRESYATRAQVSLGYIETHLLAPNKIPRAHAMKRMADASKQFTVAELAAWFYETTLARTHQGKGGRSA